MMTNHSLNEYKLSCELFGHSKDVRSVSQGFDSNTILSGSRDNKVKIWQKFESNGYQQIATLTNHENFISCVYYLESEHLICTGSNDSTICLYRDGQPEPFEILRSHESTVCSLYKGLDDKILMSGSWDKTAKIWSIHEHGMTTFINLKGHEAAVWAVTCDQSTGRYITGSADKNIIYWNRKGEKLKVLKGHTDCIRSLISLDNGSLISCGNDATIKYWSSEGDCLKEFNGHTNFIYSISRNTGLDPNIFISGGEDSSIRMWSLKEGSLGNELILPAQSVWSVCCLKNGDIVTGSSDGVVRVFTKDPKRFADDDKLKLYELSVETRKLEQNATLGGYNKNNLPGLESLNQPGKSEGQTKMVRQPDGKIVCYTWEKNQWNLVGDVVGASGGTQETSGKTLYEGKEYDFVFSVDISDTEPPKKLPYNRGEDPWTSAQKFIHKNNLPQVYLEQVANFIIKNANVKTIEQAGLSGFQDPFTGESRYVPGANTPSIVTGGNMDPFTGNSSYTSQTANQNVNINFSKGQNKHFPLSKYLTFDSYDAGKILNKLREFNKKVNENNQTNDQTLQAIIKFTEKKPQMDSLAAESLLKLLCWPKDILFPVLDITRLAIRDEQIYSLLKPSTFIENILSNLFTNIPNQLMTIRCLVNLMNHQSGRETVDIYFDKIVDGIKMLKEGSSNLQIAIATFYLNSSISEIQPNVKAQQEKCVFITEGVLEFLKWAVDLEACYRSLQTLGNLSCTPYGEVITAQLVSVDYVMDKIREMANTPQQIGWEKINECANSLIASF